MASDCPVISLTAFREANVHAVFACEGNLATRMAIEVNSHALSALRRRHLRDSTALRTTEEAADS